MQEHNVHINKSKQDPRLCYREMIAVKKEDARTSTWQANLYENFKNLAVKWQTANKHTFLTEDRWSYSSIANIDSGFYLYFF